MPRKKQGLRSYHHKTRNGCMQCKRRRVKCGMQQPECANCARRNEVCEYPPQVDEKQHSTSPAPDWNTDHVAGNLSWSLDSSPEYQSQHESSPPMMAPELAPSMPYPTSHVAKSQGMYCEKTHALLNSLMESSWLSPAEASMWTTAVASAALKYPYLQHCTQAIADMKQHSESRSRGASPIAYHHHVMASTSFRELTPSVHEENWLAVLAFAVLTLIFQFGTQAACDEDHFDLIETLRALRSSMRIEEAARPYFHQTQFWRMIQQRTAFTDPEPDLDLRSAIHSLSFLVLGLVQIPDQDVESRRRADINRQAFHELEKWTISVHGHPNRWDQYPHWPSKVHSEFLDLLAMGDDVSLLIFIHWAAILSRSPKRFVKRWSLRAGMSAVCRLHNHWPQHLAWPLGILAPQMANGPEAQQPVPAHLQLPSDTGTLDPLLAALSTSGAETYGIAMALDGVTENLPYRYSTPG